uniref:Uncharacterized protein n=1 Tax=Acrobeloides nanus TaxID=290746 RepID=A0A914CDK5_9BILA
MLFIPISALFPLMAALLRSILALNEVICFDVFAAYLNIALYCYFVTFYIPWNSILMNKGNCGYVEQDEECPNQATCASCGHCETHCWCGVQ